MFAFAIYDSKDKELFIARDRFGVKPLYYTQEDNAFIFASEIPPLLSAVTRKNEANNQIIFDYLAFNRTDQTQETFFENVYKLQHGHYLTIKNSTVTIKRWYNLKHNIGTPFNSFQEYKSIFSDAVQLRLRSDVPVGVCLSGGLDSSSIVSTLLNSNKMKGLNTFSAIYGKGEVGDESEFIAEYSTQLTNMFFVKPEAESLFRDKHNFIKAHAEPFPGTSPYAQYKVMELAKRHVVVTLDGQGADEQLAGYHYFFGFYFKELLKNFQLLKLLSESYHYFKKHNSLYAFKTFLFFLLPPSLKTSLRTRHDHGYIDTNFADQYMPSNITVGNIYNSPSLRDALCDHFEYKLEHLLKWSDRNSMFFSLESRVPFLDYRLVERTLAQPTNQIIHKGMTKYILREAMQGVLPETIRMRIDKMGFSTPEDKWFRSKQFKEYILDTINSNYFKTLGYIDVNKANTLYQKHLNEEANIAKEIWKWINIDIWHREFIN
jgi:asparagine synthase (glutamine-hydrolysing)